MSTAAACSHNRGSRRPHLVPHRERAHDHAVKGDAALQALGPVATVAVDKTGTLRRNRPLLFDLAPADGTAESAC